MAPVMAIGRGLGVTYGRVGPSGTCTGRIVVLVMMAMSEAEYVWSTEYLVACAQSASKTSSRNGIISVMESPACEQRQGSV